MYRLTITCFMILGMLTPLVAQEIITHGTLKGQITSTADHQPVAGANVQLLPGHYATKADGNGRFVLHNIPAGTYQITVSHQGYTALTKKGVKIWANRINAFHVSLSPAPPPVVDVVVAEQKDEAHLSSPLHAGKSQNGNSTYRWSGAGTNDNWQQGFNTESYDFIQENRFLNVVQSPLSTFSIDVDRASYANMRRFLSRHQQPPADAIRLEELVNYFDYNYAGPADAHPFAVHMEMGPCPWNPVNKLLAIGIQGKKVDYSEQAPSNLVFLIDVSGSMQSSNKLPLVKESLHYLVDQLRPEDRVAIVVYAGAAGLVLPSTAGSDKAAIKAAIDRLSAGGSTAGGAGIRLAYKVARDNFLPEGNNRVILATDGDFNVGVSSNSELVRLIQEKRKTGVYLTLLGYGMGNYKDSKMEQLAKHGNGNYFYIDKLAEAQKVFGKELQATLFTIASDVKLQVEFNPALVESYRLIGYENRKMENRDFADDTKDAGELGAGHTVTALYEIVPAAMTGGVADGQSKPDDGPVLKYQQQQLTPKALLDKEWLTLQLRYKAPGSKTSQLISTPFSGDGASTLSATSDNFRWASSVALFGMLLRESPHAGAGTYGDVLRLAQGAKGADADGLREEFIRMVQTHASWLAQK